MAVIRVNKTADYTVMSNAHFKEKEMSLKAKGLLSLMLSLPDSWDYSINGLVAICKENETAVKTTLNELKSFGYLVITKKKPNETQSGRFEYEYNIYEQPQGKQQQEKQGVENLPLENQGQLNTKQSTTKQSITKEKKERKNNSFDALILEYAKTVDVSIRADVTELLGEWLKVRKAKRAAMTDRAIKLNIDKLDRLAKESGLSVNAYLEEVICRGWGSFFPLNNKQGSTPKAETKTNNFEITGGLNL